MESMRGRRIEHFIQFRKFSLGPHLLECHMYCSHNDCWILLNGTWPESEMNCSSTRISDNVTTKRWSANVSTFSQMNEWSEVHSCWTLDIFYVVFMLIYVVRGYSTNILMDRAGVQKGNLLLLFPRFSQQMNVLLLINMCRLMENMLIINVPQMLCASVLLQSSFSRCPR